MPEATFMKKTLFLYLSMALVPLQSFSFERYIEHFGTSTLTPIKEQIIKHPYLTATTLLASAAISTPCLYFRNHLPEERWNWDALATTDVSMPQNFIFGTGGSAFQYEGIETANNKTIQNTWTAWEEALVPEKYSLFSYSGLLKKLGLHKIALQPRVPENERAGFACHGWTHYKEDAQLLKEIGVKAHRYSIEWCKIEPEEGVYDLDALQHYIDFNQELIDNGIMPCPNLFHHTLPLWFDAQGGFEKAENLKKFVDYACFIFTSFQKAGQLEKTKIWFTFNETIGFALAAYVDGKIPPGKKMQFKKAGIVAKNMLDAHCAIYDAFNALDSSIKIGFIHVMMPVQPYNPQNPVHQLIAQTFDHLVNDVALEYFKTGTFNWLNLIKTHNAKAINRIDFIGVNYYTHTLLSLTGVAIRPDQVCADGYPGKKRTKPLYAEGLYHTLKRAAAYGFPLVITEFGFAAQLESIELRTEYFKKHFYAMHKAMEDGVDLRGCFLWTAFDCFGWNSGQHSTHGIYHVNRETQERSLKENAWYLVKMFNKPHSNTTIEPLEAIKKQTQEIEGK